MSQEVLTIKASFNEDIRRFSVDPNINFSSLTNLVHQLFHLNDKTSYYLVYIDNEDDWIKISTDVELEEAKRFTLKSENTTLRLQVKKQENLPDSDNTSPIASNSCTESSSSSSSCPFKGCESECFGMKCIGTVLFIMGFYCRPVLALCFLLGFLFLKRGRLFNCFTKKLGKCCWTNTQCSWNPCSSYSNGQCTWNWGCCDEVKESTTTTTTTETANSSEKVSNLNDTKIDDDDNEFVNDSEDEKVEEKKVEETIVNPINWQSSLKQLQEMGFTNVKQNVQLLTKYKGNIDLVVPELVQLSQ